VVGGHNKYLSLHRLLESINSNVIFIQEVMVAGEKNKSVFTNLLVK
jgi:hypothetical protein